jgi:hypothetical protein
MFPSTITIAGNNPTMGIKNYRWMVKGVKTGDQGLLRTGYGDDVASD